MHIVCCDGLYSCFTSFKQLIEPINIHLVLVVYFVFAISGDVDLQIVVQSLHPLYLLIVAHPRVDSVHIFVNKADRPISFLGRRKAVDLEDLLRDRYFIYFLDFLL